jgi:hypothetical protein
MDNKLNSENTQNAKQAALSARGRLQYKTCDLALQRDAEPERTVRAAED